MTNKDDFTTEKTGDDVRPVIEIIAEERAVFETLAGAELPISKDAERALELLENVEEDA